MNNARFGARALTLEITITLQSNRNRQISTFPGIRFGGWIRVVLDLKRDYQEQNIPGLLLIRFQIEPYDHFFYYH